MIGQQIGPYTVLSKLGEGGMGEVYRARDTRLDRHVAIKTLPQTFVADAERVARFQREAKVLAALNHPHIAAIYGLEEAEHVTALVMELVEGEDLAQRLKRGKYWGSFYSYDVTRDGRFLMMKESSAGDRSQPGIVVVLNWFEELKRLKGFARAR